MAEASTTLGRCVARARQRLPRYEAELLVSCSLGVPRSHLYAFEERRVGQDALRRFAEYIERRCRGEPVAYILGQRGFRGLDLVVTPDVLIPRPDTETLVEAALPLIGRKARVLDLGTGSGAIALAIAAERPQATVTATDIDPACIALCRHNAARLGLAVETLLADRFDGVAGSFDVIVSNPPYVDADDPHLDRGDVRFEPRRALVGGSNGGLDFMAGLVRAAPARLAACGWLCVEHGRDQEAAVGRLFAESAFGDIRCHRDIEGRPRVTVGRCANGLP